MRMGSLQVLLLDTQHSLTRKVSENIERQGNEGNEGPPGRGYLLVAGIDPIQISPDGINPECHRLFLRILGRRLLMRASAHSTA